MCAKEIFLPRAFAEILALVSGERIFPVLVLDILSLVSPETGRPSKAAVIFLLLSSVCLKPTLGILVIYLRVPAASPHWRSRRASL